jgi:hypothetical protein
MPRGKVSPLSAEKLKELARTGADQTIKALQAELIAIERTFPELALARGRRVLRRSINLAAQNTTRMSAAARKAVSDRMKRYWAERRKAQAKVNAKQTKQT